MTKTRRFLHLAATSPLRGFALLLVLTAVVLMLPGTCPAGWNQLSPGLWLDRFEPIADQQNGAITVVRIDPSHYRLKLLSAPDIDTDPLSLTEWGQQYGLVAAINASMYQQNYATSTGYMKNFGQYNNPSINPLFGAFLAFNPKEEDLPPVQIIDKYHRSDWRELIGRYETVIQNYRMISAAGKNLWPTSDKRFPVACIGMDGSGNILFIYSQAILSVHDLNEILLGLPLDLVSVMYVEGGSIAGLYLDQPAPEVSGPEDSPSFFGNGRLTTLPNILGVLPRNPLESEATRP